MAPVLTPMKEDLTPDLPRWISLCKSLLSEGCTGLAPFGTTSEANSLGLGERTDMLDRLIDAGVPAEKLIIGAGTCAFPDTVTLSAQAARLGCGGILLLPPFYYKGVSDEGIFRATAEVIERVGDSRLRVYLYHIPPVAVIGYSLALTERLLKAYPGTVVGMKDSSGDWTFQESILKAFPGFDVLSGTEKFLLPNLRSGGAGTISAMANIIPGEIRGLYDSWQSPDADRVQARLNTHREAIKEWALIPALKALRAERHQDQSWRKVRPPLVALDDVQSGHLVSKFKTSFEEGAER